MIRFIKIDNSKIVIKHHELKIKNMARIKKSQSKKEEHSYGEVFLIVPAKKTGFPSDTRALETISEINRKRHIDVVVCDQGQTYSLVYRYCTQKGVNFLSKDIDLRENPNCLNEILDLYQPKTAFDQTKKAPNIVYLTRLNDCKTLDVIAEKLRDKGVKTEIRKIF